MLREIAFCFLIALAIVLSGMLVGAIILGVIHLLVKLQAKHEVRVAPRIPMAECSKHGMFPKKHMLTLTIPPAVRSADMPLEIEQCPFCFDERMQGAEKLIKRIEKGPVNA